MSSSKFDLSSDNPDRLLYTSGQRGSYGAASRENMENPLLSSLPNMTRSSSSVTQGDVLNFFQYVHFDPMSMVVDHKLNKPAEFKRLATAAVGVSLEDSSKSQQPSSPSPEDLRRLKSGARESGTKSRERVKIFNDCLSVVNKCFPTVPVRKRSRLDALANDRSNTLLSINRSASGMSISKMGSQNRANATGLDLEQQRPKERNKNSNSSKRTRTSIAGARMDIRANTPARPSATMDKDRDVARLFNCTAVQGDDRTVSIPVDGWESRKTKKRRTGLKTDAAVRSMATKSVDGYRELKQGMQPRLSTEAHLRLTDALGFRSGIASGGVGVAKTEATLQTSSGIRLSAARTDSDNSSLLSERREKERVNSKTVNRANSREDFSSGSPTSGPKLNSKVWAPRSGSVGGASKLPQRSTFANGWEVSSCTSKLPDVLGANNHKQAPSPQSSSPRVANWAQRPQKISRTARRNNLLPIVPANDDNPAANVTCDIMVNEKRLPANSPRQVIKTKSDNFSPAALSESEESGPIGIKSRDRNKKGNEIDEKSGKNVQKISTLLLPQRKNKAVNGKDHGDGVRRQGRTGRRFTSPRSLLPLTVEKLGNVGTTKQIRSSRLGVNKTESRAGRPPTRKLSDRKACTRQKHITINMPADFLVGSDDGREELLAAANAVTNTAQALSSPFWKKMGHLFCFISDADISYLKDQINLGTAVDTPAPAPLVVDSSKFMPYGCGLSEFAIEEIEPRSLELSTEHSPSGDKTPYGISLYQRLTAALIPEEESQELSCSGKEDLKYMYGSRFDMDCDLSGYPASNGYGVNTNRRSFYEVDHTMVDYTRYDHLQNGSLADHLMPGTIYSGYRYHNMSMNERVLMELHSIEIYPDLVSDSAQSGDEEIGGLISGLDEKYQEQVSRKKGLLGKLLSSASEAKELQEREFEDHALDKLMELAYQKYMGCCGPNAHVVKSTSGKMAKQASLDFIKCTLDRYQEFEVTGKSCFDEPLYRDMFFSEVSRLTHGMPLTCIKDNESSELNIGTSGCSVEVRTSVSVGQQSPYNDQDMYSSEMLLSADPGSEQNTERDDSWLNRVKRRELVLDDVSGTIQSANGRSERRGGTTKIGRPTVKGERKSKAKPNKQKIAHSADAAVSVNRLLGNMSDQPSETGNEYKEEMWEDPIDLSGLQIPEMDDLGVGPSNLAGQGDDLGSWLGNEDDILQDHDDYIGGLQIPFDNLEDLHMLGA